MTSQKSHIRHARRTTTAVAFLSSVGLVAGVTTGVSYASPARFHPAKPNLGKAIPVTRLTSTAAARKIPAMPGSRVGAPLAPGSHALTLPAVAATRSIDSATAAPVAQWQSVTAGLTVASTKPAVGQLKVSVTVLTGAQAKVFGYAGPVVELARTDGSASAAPVGVRIGSSVLNAAFGADYAGRARWVQRVIGTAKNQARPVSAAHASGITTLTPTVGRAPVLLAATSAPVSATGTGSFAATPTKQSDSWQVSAQTGDFSWNYPMRVPPSPAGPSPVVGLQYDSQSVDGETGSTNNQPSVVGDGWSLSAAGSIDRSYVPCATSDGPSPAISGSGDLCWSTANATVSFGGHSGALVQDAAGGWKLQGDDGTRVEQLTGTSNGTYDGDYWRLTTTDGTQYYFGLNRLPGWTTGSPVTNSALTVPVCGTATVNCTGTATTASPFNAQAWRWNLDYIVDPHGNAERYSYAADTNSYAENGSGATSYVRGGELTEIDYGMRSDNLFGATAASGKVIFGYAARCDLSQGEPPADCNPATEVAAYWPDVPWDQDCSSASCSQTSPTFWSKLMLSTVTTQVLSGGSYPQVDVWTLGHSWPDPADSTSAVLWLTQVGHVGYSGASSITAPTTTFTGVKMQNRVWVIDGLAPLVKWRVNEIASAAGEDITIGYSAQQCTPSMVPALTASPQANTKLCYPAWWTPQTTPPQPAQLDFFHKYLVTLVADDPRTGGAGYYLRHESDYYYTGTPAWRFDESPGSNDGLRTWSVWAGYDTVEVRSGDPGNPSGQHTTDYSFLQGLDGDPHGDIHTPTSSTRSVVRTASDGTQVRDSLWWAGQVLEQVTRVGSSGGTGTSTTPVLSDAITVPWASAATASNSRTYTYTDPVDSSTYHATLTTSAYETGDGTVTTSSPTSIGGSRTDTVTTSFDSYDRVIQVQDAASDADTTCTRTSYATNTAAWLIDYPSTVSEVGVACSATPSYPADAVTATATSYDGQALGVAPTIGNATTMQVASAYTAGGTPTWQTTRTVSYDALGRVTLTTDPRTTPASSTSTTYTPAAGGPVTQTDVVTDPQSWKTTTVYLPAWGVVSSIQDQNLDVTTATYDALGRRSQVWLPNRPSGSNPTPSVSYAYSYSATSPNIVTTTAVNAAGGTTTSYAFYDGLGQQRQTQTPAEGGGTVVVDTSTDAFGQPTLQSAPYYNTGAPSTTLAGHTVTLPSQTQTSYDGAGRITAVSLLNGNSTVWTTTNSYLGSDRVDTNPPAGGTPSSTYTNLRGKTTKLVQYLATSVNSSATTETASYNYDPRGDLVKMTDNPGNVWQWGYDVLGEQTAATDPDSGSTTRTFYPDGDLKTSVDAAGNHLFYTYDSLRRKTAEYSGSDATGIELAAWSYDTATAGKGLLASDTRYVGGTAGSPGSGTAYTNSVASYNSLGSPTSISTVIGGSTPLAGAYTTALGYAPDGTLSSQTDPAEGGLLSEKITYGFDSLGNVSGASSPLGSVVASITYTHVGQLGQITQSQGAQVFHTYTWDPTTLRLNELLAQRTATANATVSDDSYTYDQAGNLKEDNNVTPAAGTDTQCYSYDYLRNLIDAWTPASNSCATASSTTMTFGGPAPYWHHYVVDPGTGNRSSATSYALTGGAVTGNTTSSYHYNAAGAAHPHAVQSVVNTGGSTTTDAYSYNADGSATGLPGQTVGYDTEGRATSTTITSTGKSQANVYDADGNLLLQTDPVTGTTGYLGDTQLHVAAGSTTVSASRTYTVAGQPIAERDTTAGVTGNKYYFLDDDPHNTANAQVAAATAVVTRRYLDPFGNSRGPATTWISNHQFLSAAQNPLTTTSSTTHPLTLLGPREYDPVIGKFLAVDPVLDPANPAQNNGYSYGWNNPLSNADPTGLRPANDGGPITGSDLKSWQQTENHATTIAGDHTAVAQAQAAQAEVQRQYDKAWDRMQHALQIQIMFSGLALMAATCGSVASEHEGGGGCGWIRTSADDMADKASRTMEQGLERKFSAQLAHGADGAALDQADAEVQQAQADLAATETGGDTAYHYTFARYADSITKDGLRPGSYATPDGNLSPLQAQLDLALPPNRGLPEVKIRVDIAGLRDAGYAIPDATRVSSTVSGADGRVYTMPGGGYQMQFAYAIPGQFLKVEP